MTVSQFLPQLDLRRSFSMANFRLCERKHALETRKSAMPNVRKVVLLPLQREELQVLVRASSTPQGLARRAELILNAADEECPSNVKLAAKLGVDRDTVGLWRNRFLEHGVSGLQDAPRSGRPRSFSPRRRPATRVAGQQFAAGSRFDRDALERRRTRGPHRQ